MNQGIIKFLNKNQEKRVAPLCSSRNSGWKRVRNFVNRSPYDRDMASRSFTKNQKTKTDFQISNLAPNRLGGKISRPAPGRLGSRPPRDQVDCPVDLGVDLGVDLPGRARLAWCTCLLVWSGGLACDDFQWFRSKLGLI